jgi:prepilin-type N-terminal cleavage/methylation domain-containing protein
MHREGQLGPVLNPARSRRRRQDDAGFTLIELTVVSLIASIILIMAGNSLISLQNATAKNGSLIQEEQSASLAMAQMERDVRSASGVSFPSGASTSQQLQMTVVNASGPQSQVLWIYDPIAATLSRETQVNGTFVAGAMSISHVTNGSGTPVFTYFNSAGSDISSRTVSEIETCATAVGVEVQVASTTAGVAAFQESAEVALTNNVEALTAPGNGQCGS